MLQSDFYKVEERPLNKKLKIEGGILLPHNNLILKRIGVTKTNCYIAYLYNIHIIFFCQIYRKIFFIFPIKIKNVGKDEIFIFYIISYFWVYRKFIS